MLKRKLETMLLVGILSITSFGGINVEAATLQNNELTADKAIETLNNVAKLEVTPEKVKNNVDEYVVSSQEQNVTVNENNEIEFVSVEDDKEIGISYEIDSKESITQKIDNVIITENSDEDYFITTEIFDGGLRNCFVIDESCKEEFNIELDLPEGAYLEFAKDEYNDNQEDGSILIMDGNDSIIGAIATPWAKDSDGNDIETYYEIKGSCIVQHVKHIGENATYPIVADPTMTFSSCFDSGKWITRNGVVSLSLKPNSTLRMSMVTGSSSMKQYSWEAVKAKFSGSSKWKNTSSMKMQYECHWYLAIAKSEFNLEPSRGSTNWANMIAHACNP